MSELFSSPIPNDIYYISEQFLAYNFELRLVGGAVRDSLRGENVADFDLATNATPDEIIRVFAKQKNCQLIPTGIEHGTLTLVLNRHHYEITTYRIDGLYSNNRHPDSVSFTSRLEEDLSRRDFTVNAIAVDPITKHIYDPFLGQEDITRKIIRTVGCPEARFQEDALRMLRACRFASKLNFAIDSDTLTAIKKLSSNIQFVSQERIRDELLKTLMSPIPSIGINLMRETGLLDYIMPELVEGYKVEQNEFHRFDVYTHNLKTCDAMETEDIIARFAALTHDIGKPRAKSYALKIGNGNVFYNHEIIGAKMTDKIMKRLKFSNEDREKAVLLVELHMFYYTNDWADGAIRRFLRRFDGDMKFLDLLFRLRAADRIGSGTKKSSPHILKEFRSRIDIIMASDAALKVKDLDINGHTLMQEFNLKPSPIIGEILHYLLELVLDDPAVNEHESLKKLAKEYLIQQNFSL